MRIKHFEEKRNRKENKKFSKMVFNLFPNLNIKKLKARQEQMKHQEKR